MALTDLSTLLNLPVWAMMVVLIWSLFWKGLALWKSARLKKPVWFVILLVVNTLGILEILYIFIFSRIGLKVAKKPKPKKRRKR